jgi:hypothetical protein
MLSAALARTVALSLVLAGCGRVGVFVLPVALDGSTPEQFDEPDPAPTAPTVMDAKVAEPLDAGLGTNQPDANEPALDAAASTLDSGGTQDAEMLDSAQDASTGDADVREAGPDAGADAAADAALTACEGTRILNLCWYLGALDASCEETCSNRGGYDTLATALVGTTGQGGSLANCEQVLSALGYSGAVGEGMRADMIGMGCHVWEGDGWWIHSMPDLDPTASAPNARVACGCLR